MSGHTPGPWRIISDGGHAPIVQRGQSGGFCICDEDAARANADARLIAAAPLMLYALRRAALALSFAGETSPAMHDDYKAVSAVIAKATRETP